MSEQRKTYPGELYFVTLTVAGWVDVFIRPQYKDIIIADLQYCQQNEGLVIYEYVLMSSHLHMIAAREHEDDLSELLGRFKSTTAKRLLKMIATDNGQEAAENGFFIFLNFSRRRIGSMASIISGSIPIILLNCIRIT